MRTFQIHTRQEKSKIICSITLALISSALGVFTSQLEAMEPNVLYGSSNVNEGNSNNLPLEEKKYNIAGIALFSGNSLSSRIIETVTNSTLSHVGIILSERDDENKWYCFDSTGWKSEDPHVHLTPWEEKVRGYEGIVNYRLFVFQDGERTNPDWITSFVKDYNGKSYTKNPLTLLRRVLSK